MMSIKATPNIQHRRGAQRVKKISSPVCDSLLVCAFRRGGSSIVFQTLQTLFEQSGHRSVDLVAQKHALPNEQHVTSTDLEAALSSNQLVGCFRSPPPPIDTSMLKTVRVLLIVRDPRDCAVSWHYARKLHAGHWPDQTLDESLRNVADIISDANGLLDYADQHKALVWRYEDIIHRPAQFVSSVMQDTCLTFNREAVDWSIATLACHQLVHSNTEHNRSGEAYGWSRTLTGKQIRLVNELFAQLLERLGYTRTPPKLEACQRQEIDSLKRLLVALARENCYRIDEIRKLRQLVAHGTESSKA